MDTYLSDSIVLKEGKTYHEDKLVKKHNGYLTRPSISKNMVLIDGSGYQLTLRKMLSNPLDVSVKILS